MSNDISYFRQGDILGWVDIQRLAITLFGYGENRLLTPPFSSTISRLDDGRVATLSKTQNEWRSMEILSGVENWMFLPPSGMSPRQDLIEAVDRSSASDREDESYAHWSIPPYSEWLEEDKEGLRLIADVLYRIRQANMVAYI